MGDYDGLPLKVRYLYWSAGLFGWAKHFRSGDESDYGLLGVASLVNTVILGFLAGAVLYGLFRLAAG